MRIQFSDGSKSFQAINANKYIPVIKNNFSVDVKALTKLIVEKGEVSREATADIYSFAKPTGERLEVAISKAKQLILGVKKFFNDKCIEETSYDYNKKGEIIRSQMRCDLPSGRKNLYMANVKQNDDGLVVSKKFADGSNIVTTFINSEVQQIRMEKTFADKLVEQLEYIAGKKLESKIDVDGHSRFLACGDAQTGEMVFSRNFTKYYDEYTELMDNGKYHRHMIFDEGVVDKTLKPSVANHFFHMYKDMLTPLNDLSIKISEFFT